MAKTFAEFSTAVDHLDGWRVVSQRGARIRRYIVSPAGVRFNTVRAAHDTLLQEGYAYTGVEYAREKVCEVLPDEVFAMIFARMPSLLRLQAVRFRALHDQGDISMALRRCPDMAVADQVARARQLINGSRALSSLRIHDLELFTVLAGLHRPVTSLETPTPVSAAHRGILAACSPSLTHLRLDMALNVWAIQPMASLQRLHLSGQPIRDISGLAHCPSLTHLYFIPAPHRMDLDALRHLPSLQWLHLDGVSCNVTDVSPLAACTRLRHVDVNFKYLTDITPLSSLAALRVLRLGSHANPIHGVAALAGHCTALQTLHLAAIEDIASLSTCRSLQSLSCTTTDFATLSTLPLLPDLHHLHIKAEWWYQPACFATLSSLKSLRHLHLSAPCMRAPPTLPAACASLQHLHVAGPTFLDLSPMLRMTALQHLHLERSRCQDVKPLIGARGMEHLHLGAVDDSPPLLPDTLEVLADAMRALKELHLGACADIVSPEPIATWKGLRSLSLHGCQHMSYAQVLRASSGLKLTRINVTCMDGGALLVLRGG